jgi:SNF2 family DNA or RNA helicase
MAAPGPAVLVGTGDAWGEGVNLQDTDLLLIAMLPYTPGQIVQWEGRVARHGQKRPVMIQYLVAEHTVDEHVAGILLEKLPAVEKVSQDDSVDGLADQLMGADNEDALMESILSKLGAA